MEIHEVGPFNTELVSEMKSLAPILLALVIRAHRDQKEASRAKFSKEYEGPQPMNIGKKSWTSFTFTCNLFTKSDISLCVFIS